MTTLLQGNAKLKIRNAYARAFWLRCRKADGCQIGLVHQGGAQKVLWAWTDADQTTAAPSGGLMVEPEVRVFRIPLAAADAASSAEAFGDLTTLTQATLISENDEIEWAGGVYVVGSWNMDHFEAVWNATATRKEVRRATP
jgi:hypothetical protein